MSYRKIFWGVILITLGVLFFLKNLDILYFDWRSIFRLWPLLLVLWGISIIPINNLIKLIISFAAVILTIFLFKQIDVNKYHGFRWHDKGMGDKHNWEWKFEDDNDDDDVYSDGEWIEQQIREPYDTSVKSALLRFDAAAGEFVLGETTDNLLEFHKEGNFGKYNLTSKQIGESRVLELQLKGGKVRGEVKNKAIIKLNKAPVWDFDMDIGAAKFILDFSDFRTESIKIDGGATDIEITIGVLHPKTDIDIDAGAASITIRVPESAGCVIDSDVFLGDRDFEGFERIEKGLHKTAGFDDAEQKINIKLDAAITSLKVTRY